MRGMMKNILRFIFFILFQVFVLNKIPPLHQFITPYLYYLFILWLPFRTSRLALTVVGFFFGLVLDYFTGTIGLHAAACTMIAYMRPFVIHLLSPKESIEYNYTEPSITSLGLMPYFVYVLILTLVHHFYLVGLEWLQFGSFFYFLGKVLATTAVSLLLIMITEILFYRKSRYRTNIA